jgi:hypothetical protein
MRPEPIIQRLEVEQAKVAHAALATPAGRDGFEYGRMAGMYAGVAHAIDIKNIQTEDEERGREL